MNKNTKKYLIFFTAVIFCYSFVFAQDAQDLSKYNGKTIQKIQIKTKRIDPVVVQIGRAHV